MESDKVIEHLQEFLLKEEDYPGSAETHLHQALFEVIKTMDDNDISNIISRLQTGHDAIAENLALLDGQTLIDDPNVLRIKRLWERFHEYLSSDRGQTLVEYMKN